MCLEVIWSRHSGEYRECKCGGCFIDQTDNYISYSELLFKIEDDEYEDENVPSDNNERET